MSNLTPDEKNKLLVQKLIEKLNEIDPSAIEAILNDVESNHSKQESLPLHETPIKAHNTALNFKSKAKPVVAPVDGQRMSLAQAMALNTDNVIDEDAEKQKQRDRNNHRDRVLTNSSLKAMGAGDPMNGMPWWFFLVVFSMVACVMAFVVFFLMGDVS